MPEPGVSSRGGRHIESEPVANLKSSMSYLDLNDDIADSYITV